ncbi:putative Mg(2+) transport ATPase [compost metagenome]
MDTKIHLGVNSLIFHYEMYIRLILSFVFGFFIGFERTSKGKAAGIRTHALVCIGSCLIMILSSLSTADPMRLAAQVVSGIGFIGAGVIWTDKRNSKHGLTTAANLWITSGVGLTIGFGAYDIALITGLLMFASINSHNWAVKFGWIKNKSEELDEE